MNKRLLVTGSILGFLAVIIGAFGAHGLEKSLDADALATFETGVKYQMYHALLMLLVSIFALSEKTKKNTSCIDSYWSYIVFRIYLRTCYKCAYRL